MQQLLAFWKATLPFVDPRRVYQELYYGEDVEGLIDLPIQEILADLKQEFPEFEELAGVLVLQGAVGPLEWNWSWQYLRVAGKDLVPADREKIIAVMKKYGCGVYDVAANEWKG